MTGAPPPAGTDQPWPFGGPSSPVTPGTGSQSTTASTSDLTPVYAPTGWLLAALGVAVIALAAAVVLGETVWIAFVAWILGGPVTIGLTTAYSSIDTARRTQAGYATGRELLARVLYGASLAIGLAAVLVAAVHLALWAGRGF